MQKHKYNYSNTQMQINKYKGGFSQDLSQLIAISTLDLSQLFNKKQVKEAKMKFLRFQGEKNGTQIELKAVCKEKGNPAHIRSLERERKPCTHYDKLFF